MTNDTTSLSINTIPCGFCRVIGDDNYTILYANDYFYNMYGYTTEEVESCGFTSVSFITYPAEWSYIKKLIKDNLEAGKTCFEIDTKSVHRCGKIMCIQVRCVLDASDSSILNCIVLDVTDRMETLEKLKLGEEEQKLLLKHSNMFIYRYYMEERAAILSEDASKELYLPERVENLPESHKKHLFPESYQDYLEFYRKMQAGERNGEVVVHYCKNNGSNSWYRFTFSMVYSRDKKPIHAVVSFEDVSEQREKELAYEKWSQYNQSQLANAMIYYESNLTRNSFDRIDGPKADEIPDIVCGTYDSVCQFVKNNIVYPEDQEKYEVFFLRENLNKCYLQGKKELQLEYRRLNPDKTSYWVCTTVQLLPDPYSDDIKSFFLVKNIDEEKRKQIELQNRSQFDSLTGLLNRRTVIEQINELLQNSSPSSRHVFIMLDIDSFKQLNDKLGHQFGDRVLLELADLLRSSLRSHDIIGRLGGDEFILCLKDMPLNHALEEKMASLVRLISKQYDNDTLISGSMGVAIFPKDGLIFDDLYSKADIALYEAKRQGRNRFIFYQTHLEEKQSEMVFLPQENELENIQKRKMDLWRIEDTIKNLPDSEQLVYYEKYEKTIRKIFDELYIINVTKKYFAVAYLKTGYEPLEEQLPLNEMIRKMAVKLIAPKDFSRFLGFFDLETLHDRLFSGWDQSISNEFRKLLRDGSYEWVSMEITSIKSSDGDEVYLCFVRNIEQRKKQEEVIKKDQMLLQQEIEREYYRSIMEISGTILLEYNSETNSYYSSPFASQFAFAEKLGTKNRFYIFSQEDVFPEDWELASSIAKKIEDGEMSAKALLRLKKINGEYQWCHFVLAVLRNENGEIIRSLITITDVDKATKNRLTLEYKEEYDELTGHYNYNRYKKDAVNLLKNRNNEKYALWYCDFKNFKLVNHMYGYGVGDRVLKYWAETVTKDLKENEIFARISADNFTFLRGYRDRSEIEQQFKKVSEMIDNYGELVGKKLRLDLVAGIYLIEKEEDVLKIEDMIDRANLAQKSVKYLDGRRLAYYTEQLRKEILYEREIEAVMRQALANREFCAYFQPMIDIQNGNAVIGAEVLSRWERSGIGLVAPIHFIPLFEKNGFIAELDRFIFEEACKCLRNWLNKGIRLVKLSVNVSRVSVFQSDFSEYYIRIKEAYGIPDGLLELECTETTVVENAELLEAVMKKMRISGFYFSMDDFGSGYSSMNLLNNVTVDILKLDMVFFQNKRLHDQRNQTIVASIISMARALDMKVVAEGVESQEQLEILKKLGCDFVQGYLFSKPIPLAEFEQRFSLEN